MCFWTNFICVIKKFNNRSKLIFPNCHFPDENDLIYFLEPLGKVSKNESIPLM